MVYAFLMTKGGQQPKSPNITEKSTAEYWGSFAGMTIFSSTWSQLHVFFFLRREILYGPLCKDDTYILFLLEEELHGSCFFFFLFFLMTRQGFEALGMTGVQE